MLQKVTSVVVDPRDQRVPRLLCFNNRPRSIYQYSNMAPRLSRQTVLYVVVFPLYSSLLWNLRGTRNLEKLRFCSESLGGMLDSVIIERGILSNWEKYFFFSLRTDPVNNLQPWPSTCCAVIKRAVMISNSPLMLRYVAMTELRLNVGLRTGGIPSLQSVSKSSYHASFPHPTEADCRPFQLLPTRPPWLQMLRLPSGRLNHSFRWVAG